MKYIKIILSVLLSGIIWDSLAQTPGTIGPEKILISGSKVAIADIESPNRYENMKWETSTGNGVWSEVQNQFSSGSFDFCDSNVSGSYREYRRAIYTVEDGWDYSNVVKVRRQDSIEVDKYGDTIAVLLQHTITGDYDDEDDIRVGSLYIAKSFNFSYRLIHISDNVFYPMVIIDFYENDTGYEIVNETLTINYAIQGTPYTRQLKISQKSTKDISQINNYLKGEKITERVFNGNTYNEHITYFDGFGRVRQKVLVGAFKGYDDAYQSKDMISFCVYDQMGRGDSIIYLPYLVSSNMTGVTRDTPAAEQKEYYKFFYPKEDDYNYTFSETEYDDSPLSLPVRTSSPTRNMSMNEGHPISYGFRLNTAEDAIKSFTVVCDSLLACGGNYNAGTLTVSKVSHNTNDSPAGISEAFEYKNSTGNIIAKEVRVLNNRRITYYVYDEMERLRFIIPPIESELLIADNVYTLSQLNRYCYYTEYDDYGRVKRSLAPGVGWKYFIYDKQHRLVMTQDGNQRKNFEWTYFVYDDLGRLTEQSIVYGKEILMGEEGSGPIGRIDLSRENIQSMYEFFDNSYKNLYKSPSAILKPFGDDTFTLVKHLGSTRYGGYRYGAPLLATEFQPMSTIIVGPAISFREYTIPEYLPFAPVEGVVDSYDTRTKGMQTYEKVAVLNGGSGSGDFVERAFYYDSKGRLVQTVEKNHQGGISRYSTKYDFTGNVLASHEAHSEEMPEPVTSIPFVQGQYFAINHLLVDMMQPSIHDPDGKYFINNRTVKEEYFISSLTYSLGTSTNTIDAYYIPIDCVDIVNAATYVPPGVPGVPYVTSTSFPGEGEPLTGVTIPGPEVPFDTKLTTFTYDHRGRLLSETTTVNGSEPAVMKYVYDELGRLKSKTYGTNLISRQIEVRNTFWTYYSPSAHEFSPLLKDYLAYVLLDRHGVENWDSYEYILDDGSINPAYFICTESGLDYYYFPKVSGLPHFEDLADIIYEFMRNHGRTSWCFGVAEDGPESVQLARYISLGSASSGITEEYAYTLDGRLKSQSSDVFSMEIRSDNPVLANTLADYSGRITEVEWANKHTEYGDPQAYSFQYDNWGQLYASTHFSDNPTFGSTYETGMTYDANGNILKMDRYYNGHRNGLLSYQYSGNMLERINYGNPFEYDSNGNMTVDGRSGWKYEYNSLDLLEKAYDEDDNELAAYSWLASGQKVGVADPAGNGFVYLGSLQYVLRDGELSLESTGFGGGRIVACETTGGIAYEPLYFIRDYLGSVRAIVSGGTDGCNVVYNNYYPFGGRWSDTGEATTGRWLYNGKELQTTGGLGHLLDYGSRMYDPSLGRWFNTDPAEQFISPYNFCINSPMNYVDPDGEFIFDIGTKIITGLYKIDASNGYWRGFKGYWSTLKQDAKNMWDIFRGLYKGNAWEIISHHIWEAPQTILGLTYAETINTFDRVEKVDHYGGATVVIAPNHTGGALTLGNYITAGPWIEADADNHLFQHEFGHYLQSKASGPFYLIRYGFPSLFSTKGNWEHEIYRIEQDANARALKYFHKHEDHMFARDGRWDFINYPVDGYDTSYSFKSDANKEALKNAKVSAMPWYNIVFPILGDPLLYLLSAKITHNTYKP